ncbi:LppX_LprAFG lipoprotein [Nocardia huaxiensis]|uniref:LppX_LprAFG lipoprotein n=1 Tax=Nocardia huaxiensis TaxID=2755382 RepID=A0A7D6Z5U7_9NOCA|nr:LppX_LprAFG lipoprotein [Nocardia huaxiensis]QLY33806.1 LppX_LprAFG lipoprotein [Nocardia huaxiensis]UFS99269.1 LppX_LprAFG lipoprotein [Nocardia huaxiensis]
MNDLISRKRVTGGSRTKRAGIAAVAAVSLFAALVSGCSSDDSKDGGTTSTGVPAGTALPEGSQLIQESSRTTQTLQAVHLDLAVSNVSNLPVETVKADVTNQPQGVGYAIGEAKVRLEEGKDFTDTKFIVTDKKLYAKIGGNSNYAEVGPAEKVYDPGVILDKDRGLANLIAKVQNPKAEGREKINGVDVVKVTGTIDASVIDPIVPKAGEGSTSLPITLYIKDVAPPASGSGTTLPSEAASPGDGPNLVQAVVTKDTGTIKVTLSDWGKEVKAVKPAG